MHFVSLLDNSYLTPIFSRASSILLVSSLFNKLVIVVVPLARADNNKARFDTLFEPGRFTKP